MLMTSRRKLIGASLIGAGAILNGMGARSFASDLNSKGNIMLKRRENLPKGLIEAVKFPLIEAIQGRRSRRFARGASIPEGPLAYTSKHDPAPLSEQQKMLLLTTVAGNTGWSNLIPHNRAYLPKMPNYAGAAGGRTFPSAAGFHTTDFFYTDDTGVYFLSTKDMPAAKAMDDDGKTDLRAYLDEHKSRIVKLAEGRLKIPASPQHMEMHNEWCANVPGSMLIIPVADLAQHMILALCYLVQNGACIYDDIHKQPIPGIRAFRSIVDVENPFPLSFLEQQGLAEVTAELSTACYSGALMLQAMGLGGWMYDGINPFSILGASGDPDVPGLGFRFDMIDGSPLPHITGLEGVFEGHCPPHFSSMRAAVESVIERKFNCGGPFNNKTGGPYKNTAVIRGSAAPMDDEFIECVTVMAQYIYERFGRFPATVPAIYSLMYLQAHQLDTDFYDENFTSGAYLRTHAGYDENWG